MRKSIFSFQPFTPPFTLDNSSIPFAASAIPSMQTEQSSSPVAQLPSTTTNKNGSKFLSGLRGLPKAFLLRRRRSENPEEPPIEAVEVDPYLLIKQSRRQTCEQLLFPYRAFDKANSSELSLRCHAFGSFSRIAKTHPSLDPLFPSPRRSRK